MLSHFFYLGGAPNEQLAGRASFGLIVLFVGLPPRFQPGVVAMCRSSGRGNLQGTTEGYQTQGVLVLVVPTNWIPLTSVFFFVFFRRGWALATEGATISRNCGMAVFREAMAIRVVGLEILRNATRTSGRPRGSWFTAAKRQLHKGFAFLKFSPKRAP